MIHWGWLLFTYICGIATTLLLFKKVFVMFLVRYPDWGAVWLTALRKIAQEKAEKKPRKV